MNDKVKQILLSMILLAVVLSIFNNLNPQRAQTTQIPYSEFLDKVKKGDIKEIKIQDRLIKMNSHGDRDYMAVAPGYETPEASIEDWAKQGAVVSFKLAEQPSMLVSLIFSLAPTILFVLVWLFFMRQMQGGGGRGAMSFGRSRARLLAEDQIKITLADVAGVEEAKEEVAELVEFLRDPSKFHNLGGRIPSGVLMVGPPGTGKTLLAKAIAGEAKVPFFTISGSDFVEMFVGVGASRVRDMFEQAKKQAPCIIFIDELDAVGRHRGSGMGGGHDEREQTLMQLLVEMDGFDGKEGVIVFAATNRPDVLDSALLRPGRFDRQVSVGLPDIRGRQQILKVHMRKVPASDDIDLRVLARGTPGFSGADLANLVNEAALFAARTNKRLVEMEDLEKAKDKMIMGVERRSMVMSEEERRNTAYHEAGHAIVALKMPEHDPVYKMTIIPRARSLGVTMFLPEGDRHSASKTKLEGQIATAFGGRIAEELIFGKENVTTGASQDIKEATKIARNMVTTWGLSERVGPLYYGEDEQESYYSHSTSKPLSDETSNIIDLEIRDIIDRNYQLAKEILKANMTPMHLMADALLKYETIDLSQMEDAMAGKAPKPPVDWVETPIKPHDEMDPPPSKPKLDDTTDLKT